MTGESKKKILYIITKSVWAGASKYTYDLATSLPRDEFTPMVAAGGRGAMAEKVITAGVPYFEIKAFQRDVSFLKDVFAFFEILALFFKIKPDIIHASSAKAGGIAGAAAFVYKAAKKLKTTNYRLQTAFTAHGWTFNEPRPKWQIALIKFFSRLTCVFYDKIICVSEYDYSIALKNKIAPARKMIVIHNGIKPEEYDFLPREEARKALARPLGGSTSKCLEVEPPSAFWVGTIGEFTKNKGYKFLVDAIKKLQTKSATADRPAYRTGRLKTVLIGFDGGEKESLESQIRSAELEENVFLVEGVPNAAKHLKAFDIFVLPSLKEGLPYVLLEAGLAGLPVVASNVGGIPEIIENGKSGLLVKPGDADELMDAIKKLVDNIGTRNEFSAATREKILREFSFEKMLTKTINSYS